MIDVQLNPQIFTCLIVSLNKASYISISAHSPGNVNRLDPVLDIPE